MSKKNNFRESHFVIEYVAAGEIKKCYPMSVDSKDKCLATCKSRHVEVISVTKLYPFSTAKNQHNFDLIYSICYNWMCEMERGEREWDDTLYNDLSAMRERAEYFLHMTLPVAWMTWEDLSDAKLLASWAVEHRANKCIENGRPDLVKFC